MDADKIISAFWDASPHDRARVLQGVKSGPFGETSLERTYSEAFIVFEDTGDRAQAYELVPPQKRIYLDSIIDNPHYHTRIRTLAGKIRKSREISATTNLKASSMVREAK